jgi:hypothetical protein
MTEMDTAEMLLAQLQTVRDADYPSKLERNAARLDCVEMIVEAMLEWIIRDKETKQ